MNQDQIDTINIVHEVLRGVMLAIAAQPNVDLAKLVIVLQSRAADESVSPMARHMLADLAKWPDGILKSTKSSH